jgi:CubicO group peptidase (beta-lactamase class C family)
VNEPTSVIAAACERIASMVESSQRYEHTSHLAVHVNGTSLHDQHFRGPEINDVFSVTKTVLATIAGIVAKDGLLPPLDQPLTDVLPMLRGTPAAEHTWRHALTMTRGSKTDGPWDVDELTALPRGQVEHIASAPQLTPPGEVFTYDNGSAHLLAAALAAVVGCSVGDFADNRLFAPLGIPPREWLTDPDGVAFGYAHLKLSAADLVTLGHLWLDAGVWKGHSLMDPLYARAMTSVQSSGGEPENHRYGFLTWIDAASFFAAGWAGQHVLVVPASRAVVVTTGDPRFSFGPPPRDELPDTWRPTLELVRAHLLPLLT